MHILMEWGMEPLSWSPENFWYRSPSLFRSLSSGQCSPFHCFLFSPWHDSLVLVVQAGDIDLEIQLAHNIVNRTSASRPEAIYIDFELRVDRRRNQPPKVQSSFPPRPRRRLIFRLERYLPTKLFLVLIPKDPEDHPGDQKDFSAKQCRI